MLAIAGALVAALGLYVSLHPKFGAMPGSARMAKIQASPNQVAGEFRYALPTEVLAPGQSTLGVMWDSFSSRSDRLRPVSPIPSVKTDLRVIPASQDVLVWLGHSSFYLQVGGVRILIDPVLGNHAAPASVFNRAFEGTYPYTPEDIPDIDLLLITHDHWDHLDYDTLRALQPRIARVITGLGVGEHLERWGFKPDSIAEGDWMDTFTVRPDLNVHLLPARHYSGRLLTRNRTLWASFAIQTSAHKLFFSGDTGYGPHFSEIGSLFKGFDLAVLDTGQYDKNWPDIHMTPADAVQATQDLGSTALMPAHAGKFAMANHAWDEPFREISRMSDGRAYRLLTPVVGEPIRLNDHAQTFEKWWEGVQPTR